MPNPLYRQIASTIRSQIDSGRLRPHALAPSERTLSERFGVSRMTARRAIQELETSGHVYRSARRGTFVAEPHLELPIGSFTVDVTRAGHTPRAQVLEATTEIPDAETQVALGLGDGDRVYRIRRLRFAGDEPLAIENTLLPERLCSGLLKKDLEHSLWLLLDRSWGVTPVRAEAVFEAVLPVTEQARLLQISIRDPAILLTRTVVDAAGRPVEFAHDLYRGDRVSFRVGAQLDLNAPLR